MNRLVRTIPVIGVVFEGLQLVVSAFVAVMVMQRAGVDVLGGLRRFLGLSQDQGGASA